MSTNGTFRGTRRAELLLSCAAAAIALVTGTERASAQAFQGTPTVTAGSVSRSIGPNSETITIDSPSAIVDWSPSGSELVGPVIFLPAGHTATFQNGSNVSDFMILNRILPNDPTRPVALNGTVISQLQTVGVPGAVRGGTVLFYSPGGIIIGSTAVFDVGNLLLTTIDPVTDLNGGFFSFNTFDLQGAVDSNSSVRIEAGAQITATAENSWVAVAAPQIEQFGTVRVNGSVAYVAAEALTLTINGGLFDIVVATGSSSADNTLVHTGTTGGPASTGAADQHKIYMVAVPKNTAVTALLSGSAGFDPAVSAAIENGEIVLSAGRNVVGGEFMDGPDLPASFTILSGNYSSDVRGSATLDFVAGSAGGNLDFAGDLSLTADQSARLLAQDSIVSVDGNLTLRADARANAAGGIDVTAGQALIAATGNSAITIAGDAFLSASATGGYDGATDTGGTGTGGLVGVAAGGGTVAIAGILRGEALGTGGAGDMGAAQGGGGTGGTIALTAFDNGSLAIGGATQLSANGVASTGSGAGTTGGTGTGGTILLSAEAGGTIDATGFVSIFARGDGGAVGAATGTGGTGTGGAVTLGTEGGRIGFGGGARITATGQGGAGPDGGRGEGGTARVDAIAGEVALAGTTAIIASGTGGNASGPGSGGRGGDGAGGTITVAARSGVTASTVKTDDLLLSALGSGGTGGDGTAGVAGGRGGDGTGGMLSLRAEAASGNLALGAVLAQATGFGGDGGAGGTGGDGGRGGDGTGGSVEAGTATGPAGGGAAGSAAFASLQLDANGDGGTGGTGTAAGTGGDAAGGHGALVSEGAPVTVTGAAILSVSGFAGPGGTARGGTVEIGARRAGANATPGLLRAGTLTGSAGAVGADAAANRAGSWSLFAAGSAVEAGDISLSTSTNGAPTVRPASTVSLENGTVTATGTADLESGGALTIGATLGGRLQGGAIRLAAPFGAIAITHGGRADGTATLAGTSLAATGRDGFSQSANSRLDFTAMIDVVTNGDVTLAAAQAGQALRVDSGGTITVARTAAAPAITFRSRGIDIAPGGTLGSAATDTVRLEVVSPMRPTVIGGTSEGEGYTLDAAEVRRIETRGLAIVSPTSSNDPTRPADIIVRDVVFSGAGGLQSVAIGTPGRILVEGRLEYAEAGDGDVLTLDAGERLQVVTPAGAVLVRDADLNPAGTLIVSAPDIWVTDAALAAQLAANVDFAGRDAALLANGGPAEAGGYIQAGRAELYPGKTLFVQNSGTLDALAGITVGTGGLLIRPTGAAPAAVTAFGRGRNADGSFTTGNAFFAAVEFGGAGSAGFTAESELNRCRIVSRVCPQGPVAPPPEEPPPPPPDEPPLPPEEPPPPENPPPDPPVDPVPPVDLSHASLLGPVSPARPAGLPGAEIVDAGALLSQPLIDEPVASGGDGSLWTPDDEDEEEDQE